jgi:hypothetical protein
MFEFVGESSRFHTRGSTACLAVLPLMQNLHVLEAIRKFSAAVQLNHYKKCVD